MLIEEIDLSRHMVYTQRIEDEKHKERERE